MKDAEPRLGKLPPKYHFILNPHRETRVHTCPNCDKKMHQRKLPLFVHVDPLIPIILGYTCRYCPDCDLLVAHQDEIENLLTQILSDIAPDAVGNDYIVLGTVERDFWRQGMKTPNSVAELPDHLHDFIEVWTLKFRPAGWYPDDVIEAEEREIAQARAGFAARKAQAVDGERLERAKAAVAPEQSQRKRKRKRSKR
jgi:hypothetical protein